MKLCKEIALQRRTLQERNMKNVLHKKLEKLGTNPAHVKPPPIPLIMEMYNGKSDEDFVKLKLRRDPTYIMSDLYEFNMYLFYHGNREEFLLFIRNFNMTLAATGTLDMDAKIQHICTLVRGEELRQFDLLSADVENTEDLNVNYHSKGLVLYFFPVKSLKKIAQCAAN